MNVMLIFSDDQVCLRETKWFFLCFALLDVLCTLPADGRVPDSGSLTVDDRESGGRL